MVAIDRPNRAALSTAIDIFRDAMRPFLLRCLRRVRGSGLTDVIRRSLSPHQADSFMQALSQGNDMASAIDVNYFPPLVQSNWRAVFSAEFGGDRTILNQLWLITSARNDVSHPGTRDLERDFVSARLYDIADALGRINAPEQKVAVNALRSELAVPETDASAATPSLDASDQPQPATRARSAVNLKPWRQVIRPNQDVAQGSYQQAEFMADLQQVHDGRADSTQYGNPVDFYVHTYITPGIRALLVNALRRLSGNGGDPVIQTRTGFGGGKTHSLIALYHLVRNADSLVTSQTGDEIRAIMEEAAFDESSVLGRVAVLDGAYLSVTDPTTIPGSSDPLNTLWGDMAFQLGGQEGYDIVGEAARRGTAPGGRQLDALFAFVGPCVILIDEPVAYVRAAGPAQDSIYTFVQALTQSVRRCRNVALVITLPQSRVEAGGEAGADALDRLENLLGRVEAVWEPLAISEAFEVVRRRLFGPVSDPLERDSTCEAFARMYSNNRREYPRGVGERNYLDRMKSCYPIHPEIFDRLYQDWSSIPEFQRTRGVLRMMARCVSRLYLNNDAQPLIMPADLPLSDEQFAYEFIRLLPGSWQPVVSEVDGPNSRTDNIDRESQRFADVGGAARRVARTVFLGSAPSGATRGIDIRQVRLGTVQPGHGVPTYNDALSRMVGDLYYLYINDDRYFFHAEENLNKVSNDRANSLSDRAINEHVVTKLSEARARMHDVVLYSDDSSEVQDEDFVRLVVLPPTLSLPSRSGEEDSATPAAIDVLCNRGDSPRFKRNTLLFLTAKRDEIRNLKNEVRTYLAWDSIINGESRIPNLAGNRLGQARAAAGNADRGVNAALVRAYRWAMAPVQGDPQRAEYRLSQAQTNASDSGEVFEGAYSRLIENEALVEAISPASLASMLRQYIWNDEGSDDHLDIGSLWDLMTGNVYLHRLRTKAVLDNCIRQGVEQGVFGYAQDYGDGKYIRLSYREPIPVQASMFAERISGLLVNPEAAAQQKEEDRAEEDVENGSDSGGTDCGEEYGNGDDGVGTDIGTGVAARRARRVTASKTVEGDLSLDDVDALRDEIIRNLSRDGGEVTVEITISASKPDGFSENTIRSVRENSIQLGLQFNEEELI